MKILEAVVSIMVGNAVLTGFEKYLKDNNLELYSKYKEEVDKGELDKL